MKLLYAIFIKIRAILTDSPFISAVLCVGMISCNMMFIYTYGLIGETKYDTDTADYYLFYNGQGKKETVDRLDDQLMLLERDYTADYLTKLDISKSSMNGIGDDAQRYLIRTRNDISFFKVKTGNIKHLNTTGTVLVPEEYQDTYDKTIVLNQTELQVVGTTSTAYFIVSKQTYIDSGFVPDIVMLKILDDGNSLNSMKHLFQHAYDIEYYVNEAHMHNINLMRYEAFFLYGLCMVTFLFLCSYLYEDSAYELTIYQMFGANQIHVAIIFGGAIFVILSGCSLFTQIIHAFYYPSIFSHLFTNGGYNYRLIDYFQIYLLSVLPMIGIVIGYMLLRSRQSTIFNARRTIN